MILSDLTFFMKNNTFSANVLELCVTHGHLFSFSEKCDKFFFY